MAVHLPCHLPMHLEVLQGAIEQARQMRHGLYGHRAHIRQALNEGFERDARLQAHERCAEAVRQHVCLGLARGDERLRIAAEGDLGLGRAQCDEAACGKSL